ncbi:MAG: hypothetical protein ACLGI7_13480 [Gammaproteobacteria bacterium]
MSTDIGTAPQGGRSQSLDAKHFLEGLRNRVLRVTTGMRPGPQRLDLAIEAFWYAALDLAVEGAQVSWRSFTPTTHGALLGPIRLMIRSELINSGVAQPDALADQSLQRALDIAECEAAAAAPLPAARVDFFEWLHAQMRRAASPAGTASSTLTLAA